MLHAQEPAGDKELVTLDAEIQLLLEKHKVPSVAYAILREGRIPHLRAYGLANKEDEIRASLTTKYRIASISKMVVSIAIMQLVEAGELALDDKVSHLLPDFQFSNKWSDTHPLRVEHLLESTTGWDDISLQEFAYNNNPPLDLATSLTINPNNRTSRWPPGTRHAYANSAAAVAALMVENKTGMSFYSYAEQNIFMPLGIKSATYSEPTVNNAIGYKRGDPVAHKAILMRPAGGLSVNIEDMAKLADLFISRRVGLLSAESFEGMEHSKTTNVGEFAAGYGLFNYSRYYDGIRYRGHDGALPGWFSELSYSPKHKVGFVVLQNSEEPQGFRAVVSLITEYLAKDFIQPELTTADIPKMWAGMSGYYRYQNPRFSKRFFIERLASVNKLEVMTDRAVFQSVFPPGWMRELTYQGLNTWQNDKGEAVMKLGDDPILGKVLHYGDRVFEPVSIFSAWIDKIVLVVWLLTMLSMLLHSLVWPIQRLRGKLEGRAALRFRLSISAATWSTMLFILFLGLGLGSPIERLGNVGVFSLGLFVTSLLFAIATLWAIWTLIVMRKADIKTFLYRYSALYLFAQLLVLIYLSNFGAIGILSWS